jgi:hypothetical protein
VGQLLTFDGFVRLLCQQAREEAARSLAPPA